MKRRSDLAAGRPAISLLVPGLAALAVLLAPAAAHAYCRTAACDSQDTAWQVCTPEAPGDCGTPLFWPNRCVGFTMQQAASAQVGLGDAESIFEAAFATWMNADCGQGTHPSIEIAYQGPVECDAQEYNKEKSNANIIMFRDDGWEYGGGGILALTTVTYHKSTGEIYDADMELNSQNVKSFSVGDDSVEFDLLSIATHETGHFLGIAHSADQEATMFTNYQVGTITLRDLTADDVAAICAAYPPGMPKSTECDAEPRHGFSATCAADQPEPVPEKKGCAVAAAGQTSGSGALAALGVLVGLGAALRRRRGRDKTS